MVGSHARIRNSGFRFAEPLWDAQSPERIALSEHLGADHLAKVIDAAVAGMDLTPLYQSFSNVGNQAHRPDLMFRMALFAMRRGRHKPSQWYEDCRDNCAMHWLGCGIRPSRTSWYEFRDRLAPLLDDLNQQVLGKAVDSGLTDVTRGALDGSAIAANASRRRLVDATRLEKRLEQLEGARGLDEKGAVPEDVPAWMAKTPQTRTTQQTRFQQARKRLHDLQEEDARRTPSQRKKKIVINTADPEAALGLDKEHVFRPLYTVQTVRDLDSQFILGYDVYAQATDADTLKPMMARVVWLTGRRLATLLVDCGYVTGYDLAVSDALGICLYGPWKENDYSPSKDNSLFTKNQFAWLSDLETYRCPENHVLKRTGTETRLRSGGRSELLVRYVCPVECCQACSVREKCTTSQKAGRSLRRSEHEDHITAHRAKMATEGAKALYKLRGQSIEIVFADFKEHRQLRRFSGRGLQHARAEFACLVLCHNLLLLHGALQARENEPSNAAEPEKIAA